MASHSTPSSISGAANFYEPVRQNTDHYDNVNFLHSTNHPGFQLMTYLLTSGADFHSWRISVKMPLNIRNKLGFIDGMIRKSPYSDREYGS